MTDNKMIIEHSMTWPVYYHYMLSPERRDAGFDLKTPVAFTIEAGQRIKIDIPIKWQPPRIPRWLQFLSKHILGAYPVWVGRILPRSGLAVRDGIDTLAGVIDESYRGELGVVLHNTSSTADTIFEAGDKIAQLVIFLAFVPTIKYGLVDDTDRADSGFGSTGN